MKPGWLVGALVVVAAACWGGVDRGAGRWRLQASRKSPPITLTGISRTDVSRPRRLPGRTGKGSLELVLAVDALADLEEVPVGITEEAPDLRAPVVRGRQEFGSPSVQNLIGLLTVLNPDSE